MERVKNYLLGSAVLIITALILTLATDVRRAVADEFKDVRVINSALMPANVRVVDNAARQSVHFDESYVVPAGKRLVVENVSVRVVSENAQCPAITVALLSGTEILHLYAPPFIGSLPFGPGLFIYESSQETRAYIDQNRTASLGLEFNHPFCTLRIEHAGVSGYLVDL